MAVVTVIQFPEMFKANPAPQIADEHGLPFEQGVVALAPTEAKWKPAAAAEQADPDDWTAQPEMAETHALAKR